MEEEEVKQNVKLGAFVITGIALFLIAVFFIGSENNIFNKTFGVATIFKNIEGLKEGDKVWLSGVKIGTVKSVKIVTEGQVVVGLSLNENQNEFIRKDATASIGSDGLIGNKIVVIRTGTSPAIIKDGDTLNTLSPADTQELINIAKDVGENTRSITLDLKDLSSKITKGQGIVGELLNEGNFATELRQTLHNLKTTGQYTAQATADLSAIVYEMKNGKGIVPTLLSDTTYARTLTESMDNIKKVSANAASLTKSLESVTAKMNSQNNAIGVLLADTTFARRLKTVMKNSEQASYKLDENMEALQHNFLTRGYFKKKAKEEKAKEEKKKNGK